LSQKIECVEILMSIPYDQIKTILLTKILLTESTSICYFRKNFSIVKGLKNLRNTMAEDRLKDMILYRFIIVNLKMC